MRTKATAVLTSGDLFDKRLLCGGGLGAQPRIHHPVDDRQSVEETQDIDPRRLLLEGQFAQRPGHLHGVPFARVREHAHQPQFLGARGPDVLFQARDGAGDDLTERAALELVGEPDVDELTLAQTINRALSDVLGAQTNAIVFGEDVARKGGVYGVTRGLQKRFGSDRVFDTLLDEQSILGLALGTGLTDLLPIPEIQYLAYLHNAEDQLRGEAASLRFFSNGQYRNPMVVRVAGYGYQRGFGGHFHNDNSVAVLRDIPGLVIASPSHPSDAVAMLKTCVASAKTDGSVCIFVEPIARYHTTDLHTDGDGGWLAPYEPDPAQHISVGSARTHGDGSDLTIMTWGNGLFLSLRAQLRLAREHGLDARVVDLRWLAPLPVDDLIAEANASGRVLVVDETRRTGGVGEGVLAALVEGGFRGSMNRVAALDSFVPLGAAANLVLVDEGDVIDAAMNLVSRSTS